MRTFLTSLALLLISITTSIAQPDDWDLTLDDGTLVEDVTLLSVENDTLAAQVFSRPAYFGDDARDTVEIAVARIIGLRRSGGWNFWTGGGIGFAAGAGAGALVTNAQVEGGCEYCGLGIAFTAPIGGIVGFLIGGAVGEAIDDDLEYVFAGNPLAARSATLRYLLR